MEAYLEWLSSNSQITYPFKENVSRTSTAGFILPEDVIIDLVISGVDSQDRVFLRELKILLNTVSLTFHSVDLAADIIAITLPLSHDLFREVQSTGTATDSKYTLRLVPGEGWGNLVPTLTHIFTLDTAEIEPSCIIPEQAKVLSIDLEDDPNMSVPGRLQGDVLLANGCNMEVVQDDEDGSFAFNAVPGGGEGPCYSCDEDDDPLPGILTINGLMADARRNFKIQASECIEVRNYREQNMIALHDHCRPCCDCDRLIDLDARITVLEGP